MAASRDPGAGSQGYPAQADITPAENLRRIRWRCRRGMRELDALLMRYADQRYLTAMPAEQQAFEGLLMLPDPEILDLLMGRRSSEDSALDRVVSTVIGKSLHSGH